MMIVDAIADEPHVTEPHHHRMAGCRHRAISGAYDCGAGVTLAAQGDFTLLRLPLF